MKRKLMPGQLWWDKNHKWQSEKEIQYVYLTICVDDFIKKEDGTYREAWQTARYWIVPNKGEYGAAGLHPFYDDEMDEFVYLGSISSLPTPFTLKLNT